MALMSVLAHGTSLNIPKLPSKYINRPTLKSPSSSTVPQRLQNNNILVSKFFRPLTFRIRSFQHEDAENYEAPKYTLDDQDKSADEGLGNEKNETAALGSSFLLTFAIPLGIAVIFTILSVSLKQPSTGFFGVQFLAEGAPSSVMATTPVGFTVKAFGYRMILPEYAPGGVCISDMIPFYLGKLFRQTGASDDICSKLGISEEKVLSITGTVQKYGNLAGMVERFSLGVRNPTAFLAGTLGISPECFLAGVCCGGLITLPFQLAIGFLLRERPVFGLASVATVVGIWTVFPYAVAASTALFLYLRRHYST